MRSIFLVSLCLLCLCPLVSALMLPTVPVPHRFEAHCTTSTGTDTTTTLNIKSTLRLNDGNTIPRFGLGVYQAANGGETKQAVLAALVGTNANERRGMTTRGTSG